VKKTAVWAEIPGLKAKSNYAVHDMWKHKPLGVFHGGFNFKIAAHDTVAFLITEVDGRHPHPAPLGLPEVYRKKPRTVTEV
jgi:alpha-galactosidase